MSGLQQPVEGTSSNFRYTNYFNELQEGIADRKLRILDTRNKPAVDGYVLFKWRQALFRDIHLLERRELGIHEWSRISEQEMACPCGLVREVWMQHDPSDKDSGHINLSKFGL